jgi:PAS domain-containing protein
MTWAADRAGRLYYASADLLAWYGIPFATLFDYGWAALIHPDDINEMFRAIESTMSHGQEISLVFRGLHHSREWRWLASVGRPIGPAHPHLYHGFAKPL